MSARAQVPVDKWADAASWATAFVNPIHATVDALRSDQKACRLGRIAISEAIVNGTALTMKHFIVSPRPCLGCAPDGMPSGHTANSMVGSFGWNFGIAWGAATAGGRVEANRHTKTQVAVGMLIGTGGELGSRLLHCGP